MSNLNPQFDDNEDLGSSLRRWRKVYISKDLAVDRNVTVVGTVAVTGLTTLAGGIAATLPVADPAVAGQLWANSKVVTVSTG